MFLKANTVHKVVGEVCVLVVLAAQGGHCFYKVLGKLLCMCEGVVMSCPLTNL